MLLDDQASFEIFGFSIEPMIAGDDEGDDEGEKV